MATAPEQERRQANAGLRGLVLLVQCEGSVTRLRVPLRYFFGMVTVHLHLGVAQFHQEFRDSGAMRKVRGARLLPVACGRVPGNKPAAASGFSPTEDSGTHE